MSYGRNIKRIAQHIHRRNANRYFHDLRSEAVMFLLVRLNSEVCKDRRALTVNRGEVRLGEEEILAIDLTSHPTTHRVS